MAGGVPWTRKEEQETLAAVIAGVKISTIAKRLGRSHSAVAQKVCVLLRKDGKERRQPKRYKPNEFATLVVRLSRPGVADGDVAKILGCLPQTVLAVRKRLGIPSGCRKHIRLMKPERRPPGHIWRPGELTVCVTRLLALNDGLGIPAAEMAKLLSTDNVASIENTVNFLLRGVRDEMDDSARPLSKPEPIRRYRHTPVSVKANRKAYRLDSFRRYLKRVQMNTEQEK